jgi:hypothetical protein
MTGMEEFAKPNSSVFDRNQTLFYSLYRVGAKSTSLGMASEQHLHLSSFGIPLIVKPDDPGGFSVSRWATRDKSEERK